MLRKMCGTDYCIEVFRGKKQTRMNSIPWQKKSDWTEVQLSVRKICGRLGMQEERARELAQNIQGNYKLIDASMEELCAATCISCEAVCCSRATVWYDLRDLLFLYLVSREMPEQQVLRREGRSCANLGPAGCVIPRSKRPFICTWYICAVQKKVLESVPESKPAVHPYQLIAEIQTARKLLESLCIAAVCS